MFFRLRYGNDSNKFSLKFFKFFFYFSKTDDY